MKTSFILFCLALFVAAVFADCDPDGNGIPSCSGSSNSNTKYSNFWDPTRYWICQGGSAVSVECEIIGGFDQASSQCITWDQWNWVPPCPAT